METIIDMIKYASFRKYLHTIPEIAFQEYKTKEYILSYIKKLNNHDKLTICEVLETGFYIDLKGEGKSTSADSISIAFRADLDALPLIDENTFEHKSTHHEMAHACGHDGHLTILTAFLEALLAKLDSIPGNLLIRLIYQPAEEGIGGADKMIEKGCLEGIQEIYAIHNVNLSPIGCVGVKPGVMMAGSEGFDITITGMGGARLDAKCM